MTWRLHQRSLSKGVGAINRPSLLSTRARRSIANCSQPVLPPHQCLSRHPAYFIGLSTPFAPQPAAQPESPSTRGRKDRYHAQGTTLTRRTQPNDLWCADFKGEFMLADRRYCYP
jgi:hypothetical protein